MPILPDLQSLRTAADAVDRTAATVEADADAVGRLLGALPWSGPVRDRVVADATAAVSVGRAQAQAERALARALRQLALDVEGELRVLAGLAASARRHLEELLRRASALVAATAEAVAHAVASGVTSIVIDVISADPAAAVRDARRLAEQANETMHLISVRLESLPEPSDPAWHRLAPDILAWRPL